MNIIKPLKSALLLGMLCVMLINYNSSGQSAIYAGGPVYHHRDYAIDELRNSGFNTVIVWTIHIQENGDFSFNAEFPIVKSGKYVGHKYHPNFPSDIEKLKTAPTSINRIEFGLSAAESGTFEAVRKFYEQEGFGPGTTLYQNFLALKNAIPGIDAFNNDDESTYDLPSAVAFTKMLAGLGYKNAIVPYQNSGFWKQLVEQVNKAYPGNIDRNYLQCYAGGRNNNPCDSKWNFGIPIFPGLWGGPSHLSAVRVENQLEKWKSTCGIDGGFMWLYDAFDHSPAVKGYATAILNAITSDHTQKDNQQPKRSKTKSNGGAGASIKWQKRTIQSTLDTRLATKHSAGVRLIKANQKGWYSSQVALDLFVNRNLRLIKADTKYIVSSIASSSKASVKLMD